jgi:hypothetical protein
LSFLADFSLLPLGTLSEIFLVQIRQKFWKTHSEVRIQGKQNLKNAFRSFCSKVKSEYDGGVEGRVPGVEEKNSFLAT